MRLALFLLCIALAPSALGADFYVEGPTVAARSDAVILAQAAKRTGMRARILRRYRHGVGWEYVTVVEGMRSEEAASAVAATLTSATGLPLSIYSTAERALSPPADPGGELKEAPEEPDDVQVEAEPPAASIADRMLRAVRAHGGLPAGREVIENSHAVLFRFRRRVPGGPTVLHTYARRGDDIYLDLRVEEGEGVSSQTVIAGESATVVVDGRGVARDAALARTMAERFAPDHVLAFTLGFAEAATSRREFQLLYDAGETLLDGAPCDVLRFDGDRLTGRLELTIDRETHLLRRVRLEGDGGEVQQQFMDYRELAGLPVPGRVVVERNGAIVDDVHVLDLELEPTLPDGWFASPAG